MGFSSTFLLCLRNWHTLCTPFMTMARVVVSSGGSNGVGGWGSGLRFVGFGLG